MYQRILNIPDLLRKRSHFLFGPRATGKSTLVGTSMPEAKTYDLLKGETFQRLLQQPSLIEQETSSDTLVIIDEIQKLPALLDEVHRLIESRKQRFLLTGSSARKLRHGGANLLAGRAFQANLFPLVRKEIDDFNLITYLNSTGLPEFCGNELAGEFLSSYVGTYLTPSERRVRAMLLNLSE
jgi:predicted AAA+ superfamily ATPase